MTDKEEYSKIPPPIPEELSPEQIMNFWIDYILRPLSQIGPDNHKDWEEWEED